jgi:hypothetical protein
VLKSRDKRSLGMCRAGNLEIKPSLLPVVSITFCGTAEREEVGSYFFAIYLCSFYNYCRILN